jgi:hypothetical protein
MLPQTQRAGEGDRRIGGVYSLAKGEVDFFDLT